MSPTPRENLEALRRNSYPGRGISVGLNAPGTHILQAYWITGRSANSRNRVFVAEGTTLRTAPADPSKVKDPSLIIYNAMLELPGIAIVTNGDQTDTIYEGLKSGKSFCEALQSRTYEPDPPNYTPRISAICGFGKGKAAAELSVLRKSKWGEEAERFHFQFGALPSGAGLTITTYLGDGDPLPSFEGEPYLLPLEGSPREAAEALWEALDKDNRVSLAVKSISMSSGNSDTTVINAYEAVE